MIVGRGEVKSFLFDRNEYTIETAKQVLKKSKCQYKPTLKQCEIEKWSVRELKRQMKSMLFHRLALSKDKDSILQMSAQGVEIQSAKDIIKDPYIFEFLGIPERQTYLEGELKDKLIQDLELFLLELGKGFAFIGRQYRISLANRHYYVDLVFYHRILK